MPQTSPSSAKNSDRLAGSFMITPFDWSQEAAKAGHTDWSKIDASLHTQCFHGMALSSESWCSLHHSMDHIKNNCPLSPGTCHQPNGWRHHSSGKAPPLYVAASTKTMESVHLCPNATTNTYASVTTGPIQRPYVANRQPPPSPQ